MRNRKSLSNTVPYFRSRPTSIKNELPNMVSICRETSSAGSSIGTKRRLLLSSFTLGNCTIKKTVIRDITAIIIQGCLYSFSIILCEYDEYIKYRYLCIRHNRPKIPVLIYLTKMKKNVYMGLFFTGFLIFSCASNARSHGSADMQDTEIPFSLPAEGAELPVSTFGEIWAYVVAGREDALKPGMPITDIAYFGAEINSYGSLVDVPRRRNLPAFSGRVHLVVACNGRALSYFVLKPGSAERTALITGLLAACGDYDGLQIDFENVSERAGDAYFTFLKELRAGLNGKMLTLALSARTKKIANDVYDYEKIPPIADRVLVMAYDEHWSGSKPGSIASLPWCARVADYSLKTIGPEKLIMGLPFYGRAWGHTNPSRALVYSTIDSIIKEHQPENIQRENGIPTFEYAIPVLTTVYYEDEYSLSARMEMYKSQGVAAIGFWRLGQETPAVWKLLALD